MRTCLCCCNVSAASLIIGMVWLIMASLMMVPLSSILSMVQLQGFMFQENLILFEEELLRYLPRYNLTEDDPVYSVLVGIPQYTPHTVLVCTVYCAMIVLESGLLIAGVKSQVIPQDWVNIKEITDIKHSFPLHSESCSNVFI